MKLIFLGAGSAFTVGDGNYQSNMLLESENGKRLLIDCGTDARFSLYEQGFSYKDIQDIYVSHLHADHVGGLEWLAFSTKFDPACQKITLHLSHDLIHSLWDHVLFAGLSSLHKSKASLSTYFEVDSIPRNGKFYWENVEFQLIQTIHVVSEFTLMPSYGLLFRTPRKIVFLTTDTQLAFQEMKVCYEQADIIFQDCETKEQKSGVHAHYSELVELDSKIKKKMWLYHYQPGELPNAVTDGFCGFVKKGQVFFL